MAECAFRIDITSAQPSGVNPEGGITNVQSDACNTSAIDNKYACIATAEADWWLACCPDPEFPDSTTPHLVIDYDLVVDNAPALPGEEVVASSTVTIREPPPPLVGWPVDPNVL